MKSRFSVIAVPNHSYSQCTLSLIIWVCVILHDMIIDDEHDDDLDEAYETFESTAGPLIHYNAPSSLTYSIQMDAQIQAHNLYSFPTRFNLNLSRVIVEVIIRVM